MNKLDINGHSKHIYTSIEKKNVIEIRGLSKTFGGKTAIDNLNLTVRTGEIYGFLGPNGAGKTTTIRMLLDLVHPDRGTVKLNGFDIRKDFRRAIERVGAVVETPMFYPYLSGYNNLRLIARLHPAITNSRIAEVLEMVGLSDRAGDKVGIYSLGMRQRLGLARALTNNPQLIILDEPTNGLDPQGMKEVREMISQLALEQDITFFISSHLLNEVEQVCNRVGILHRGKLLTEGTVPELLQTDHETIELGTPYRKKVLEILQGIAYVKDVQPSSGGLIVETEKGYSAKLNEELGRKGIFVNYLIPQQSSLEQYFIEKTEGGQRNA